LKHPFHRHPQIGLLEVVVYGFNHAGIGQCDRHLNSIQLRWNKIASDPLVAEAKQLPKTAAVVRPLNKRLGFHARDDTRRVGICNNISNAWLQMGHNHQALSMTLGNKPRLSDGG
jgi:hypothetical protein